MTIIETDQSEKIATEPLGDTWLTQISKLTQTDGYASKMVLSGHDRISAAVMNSNDERMSGLSGTSFIGLLVELTLSWKSCRAVEPKADIKEFLCTHYSWSQWWGWWKSFIFVLFFVFVIAIITDVDLPIILTVSAWLWLPGWQDSHPLLMCTFQAAF